MYTNFVFDVDGTIINSDHIWNKITRQVMREYLGRRVTKTDTQAIRGMSDDLMLRYFQITDATSRAGIFSMQREIYLRECHKNRYYEGVMECIDVLRACGRALGIVTNRIDFELQEPLWMNLVSKMDIVITGEMVQLKKPNPEPLNRYLELAKVDRSKVLLIGDTNNDAVCAEEAGVDFALALWGTHAPDLKAKYRFEKPMQLVQTFAE
jgi:HAD superfamily hydrolase (TIGR01549 family)